MPSKITLSAEQEEGLDDLMALLADLWARDILSGMSTGSATGYPPEESGAAAARERDDGP